MSGPDPDAVHDRLGVVYAEILSRAPEHDIDPTLDRVRDVLDLLGNPQRAYKAVHVTGTNGKTSTSRMVESLVRAHGLRTGRFTSPHLTSVTERIAIDGEPISAERFIETYDDVIPYISMIDERSVAGGGPRLSFFEVLTVMAYAAFADAPIDVAIVEVGMGGRWDSTNVIDAQVSVITPIALDHVRWLGSSIAEIAAEKAGIIKSGATAIVATQPPAARRVIEARIAELGVLEVSEPDGYCVMDRTVAVGGQVVTVRTPAAVYEDVMIPLHGRYQAHNAAAALAATEALMGSGRALDGAVVQEAFGTVTSPGRLELVSSSPVVIVDAAHNPAGAQALVESLDEAFALRRVVAVVAMMSDKEAEGFLAELEPHVSDVVVTSMPTDRAFEIEELAEIADDVFGDDRVYRASTLADAIDAAAALAESDMAEVSGVGGGVIVTGSVVLAAHARTLFGRDTA
ncbi:bifunctional folylpolyglutamate synthase/dihydrofolate synthase [Rarobacter incanus]|uniref:Dihydrofolate synthase/folylpolyglutamate synthase n=1 Tax=Rarobacter incanus TaxID=153494 RepID=A0A542SLA2_9MICO|nr:folylpolyglutamate synthase/dihydrofolate synthase family protein [Rarobacter incanus]TQK75403.1 dihydrofolate synthase/folylpolyglutamate synthase [Rarobacter incanus]